jgi:hypothetical protein
MVALKAKFDGKTIEVPQELKSAGPAEVIIVFQPAPAQAKEDKRPSMWDAFGKGVTGRSAEEIIAQVRADRDEFGDR